MELVNTDAWESSAESRFRKFPYRVGSTKWKWKWQLEAFTEVGKLLVPGPGQAVPWGPAGWAGVWRLRRVSSSFAEGRVETQVWREEEAGL